MSKFDNTSLRVVMQLSVEQRLSFIKINYPLMNIDLVSSLLNGVARLK